MDLPGVETKHQMKYRIYIDETGNADLNSSDNPNHRYLGLTGVIIDLKHSDSVIHPEIEKLKRDYFGSHSDDPVILHRKEMVNKKHPFHILENESVEKAFNSDLLTKLKEWEYTLVSVLIDKKEHSEMYQTWKFDPYHYCMAILLERYIFFLEEHGATGDVMSEARGGKEDMRLKDSFHRLYEKGTEYLSSERFGKVLTSSQLKVKPKYMNISGLQIADILAHPARRHCMREYGIGDISGNVFGDEIIKVIQDKYYCRYGKIKGYGLKKVP